MLVPLEVNFFIYSLSLSLSTFQGKSREGKEINSITSSILSINQDHYTLQVPLIHIFDISPIPKALTFRINIPFININWNYAKIPNKKKKRKKKKRKEEEDWIGLPWSSRSPAFSSLLNKEGTTQSATMVNKYPAQANMNEKGYIFVWAVFRA